MRVMKAAHEIKRIVCEIQNGGAGAEEDPPGISI